MLYFTSQWLYLSISLPLLTSPPIPLLPANHHFVLSIWVCFFFYCIFFHYHLVPFYPPPTCDHHTVVHVHESFFLFAQYPYHISSPALPVILLSINEYVSILLVSSVCSLDSTYRYRTPPVLFWNSCEVWLPTTEKRDSQCKNSVKKERGCVLKVI